MRIRTPRLHLREMEAQDAQPLFEMESLPEVVRYQAYEAWEPGAGEKHVREAQEATFQIPRTYVELSVCLTDGAFIGRVGTQRSEGVAWLWYALHPRYHGQGLAREAMRAFLEQLSTDGFAAAFQIECDPRNVPSWKLAEALGFLLVSASDDAFEVKGERVGSRLYRREPQTSNG